MDPNILIICITVVVVFALGALCILFFFKKTSDNSQAVIDKGGEAVHRSFDLAEKVGRSFRDICKVTYQNLAGEVTANSQIEVKLVKNEAKAELVTCSRTIVVTHLYVKERTTGNKVLIVQGTFEAKAGIDLDHQANPPLILCPSEPGRDIIVKNVRAKLISCHLVGDTSIVYASGYLNKPNSRETHDATNALQREARELFMQSDLLHEAEANFIRMVEQGANYVDQPIRIRELTGDLLESPHKALQDYTASRFPGNRLS